MFSEFTLSFACSFFQIRCWKIKTYIYIFQRLFIVTCFLIVIVILRLFVIDKEKASTGSTKNDWRICWREGIWLLYKYSSKITCYPFRVCVDVFQHVWKNNAVTTIMKSDWFYTHKENLDRFSFFPSLFYLIIISFKRKNKNKAFKNSS